MRADATGILWNPDSLGTFTKRPWTIQMGGQKVSSAGLRAFKGFADPMQLVDRTDLPYEKRLAVLQEWKALLASESADEDQVDLVDGAIHSLEMGSEIQDDAPHGAPALSGYGKPSP
jgi:hypothetical protein